MSLITQINHKEVHFCKVSHIANAYARIKNSVSVEYFAKNLKFWSKIWVIRTKPVIAKTHEFVYRCTTVLLALFGRYRLFWFRFKIQKCRRPHWLHLHKVKVSFEMSIKEITHLDKKETEFDYRDASILRAIVWAFVLFGFICSDRNLLLWKRILRYIS